MEKDELKKKCKHKKHDDVKPKECTSCCDDLEDDKCACGDECDCSLEEVLILKDNIKNLEEKVLLAQAELVNYRKRKDDEVSNILKYANQDIITELLPVIDNFERAISFSDKLDDNSRKVVDGYKIVYQGLMDIIGKFGVEVINPVLEVFDPTYHNALLVDKDESKEEDVILEVLSKGYILKGRVIRPASVKVNKLD